MQINNFPLPPPTKRALLDRSEQPTLTSKMPVRAPEDQREKARVRVYLEGVMISTRCLCGVGRMVGVVFEQKFEGNC